MTNPQDLQSKFQLEKANAHFAGKWRRCLFGGCHKWRTCTGGPRGTCRKTGGVPLCAINEAKGIRMRHRWCSGDPAFCQIVACQQFMECQEARLP